MSQDSTQGLAPGSKLATRPIEPIEQEFHPGWTITIREHQPIELSDHTQGDTGGSDSGSCASGPTWHSQSDEPGYQEHEATEVVLPQFVLLAPEPDAVNSADEREELAEMEAEYQEMMKEFLRPDPPNQ